MMRSILTPFLCLAAIIAAAETQAAIIFTAGGADANAAFADDNYDFSGSSVSAIDEDVTIADDVTMTGTTLNANDFIAGFGQYQMGDGFSLTLDSATFVSNGSGGIAGVDDGADAPSFFNLNNGSHMDMQFVSVGAVVNVDGTSSLRFRGGGDPINSQTERSIINLAPGAQLILPSAAEFTEQGVDILVNGVAFADNTDVLMINGGTATAVAPIPEPMSIALLAMGLIGALRVRGTRS